MKRNIYYVLFITLLFGCSQKSEIILDKPENMRLLKSDFSELPNFYNENYDEVLGHFKNNCQTKKTKKLYGALCIKANDETDAKEFITKNFTPYQINSKNDESTGLLTGYYEPTLYASLSKDERYKYPIYETPKDLIVVDLSSIYPDLKNYRLRGKIEGQKLIPYDTRAQSKLGVVNADTICYCDSKIDRFFLEIQGSGRVRLDNNETLFIGYDNQNGHKYRAIGRYLVKQNELRIENVSLQSIKAWLEANPSRVEEVLNYNKSMVYFKQRTQGATGALGLELTPFRSVAVDKRYIPLGSMLYLNSDINKSDISKIVFAQDTGGAIKGVIRADLFLGSGAEALEIAGRLKSKLQLWILIPKNEIKKSI